MKASSAAPSSPAAVAAIHPVKSQFRFGAADCALAKFGKDTLFLPTPDFGKGPKIGAASWQFGVSAASQHPDGAAALIKFVLQDK